MDIIIGTIFLVGIIWFLSDLATKEYRSISVKLTLQKRNQYSSKNYNINPCRYEFIKTKNSCLKRICIESKYFIPVIVIINIIILISAQTALIIGCILFQVGFVLFQIYFDYLIYPLIVINYLPNRTARGIVIDFIHLLNILYLTIASYFVLFTNLRYYLGQPLYGICIISNIFILPVCFYFLWIIIYSLPLYKPKIKNLWIIISKNKKYLTTFFPILLFITFIPLIPLFYSTTFIYYIGHTGFSIFMLLLLCAYITIFIKYLSLKEHNSIGETNTESNSEIIDIKLNSKQILGKKQNYLVKKLKNKL